MNEDPNIKPSSKEVLNIARNLRFIGPDLNKVVLLHIAKQYTNKSPLPYSSTTIPDENNVDLKILRQIMQQHTNTVKTIDKLELTNIHSLKPMINGKEVQRLYKCGPGPHIKPIINECIDI